MAKVVALIVVHSDVCHLRAVIRALHPEGGDAGIPVLLVVNRRRFHGPPGDWSAAVRIGEEEAAEVLVVDARGEKGHRREALRLAREHPAGYTHAIVVDADEVLQRKLLCNLLALAEADLIDIARCWLDTFWWDCCHVVRPREAIRPVVMVNLATAEYLRCREWRGERDLTLSEAHGLMLHLSWNRPLADAQFKLAGWGHAGQVRGGWFAEVFLKSRTDPLLRHVHPTHAPAYDHIVRIPKPAELADAWDGNLAPSEPELAGDPPRCSAVIPVHGNEDILDLLPTLYPLVRKTKRERGRATAKAAGPPPLFDEVVVVDDASPDGVGDRILEMFPWVRLVRLAKNVGYAAACCIGVQNCARTSESIFLLNSDTLVCRSGLIPMFNTFRSSASIGVVGVMTNEAGYAHPVPVCPDQLENLELFCRDFAARDATDIDLGMIVGFAMLVRRSVWDLVGGMDPNFFPGTWDDTDFVYRVQRAHFRCVLSGRAFVLHKGSRTIRGLAESPRAIMSRNEAYFLRKHRDDTECGYPSHLPGGSNVAPIVFNPERHPDVIRAEIRRLAPIADVGLCVICGHDPASSVEEMARSAQDVFTQRVAYLNQHNPEAKAVLLKYGFDVYEGPFVDFAQARNVALSHMRTPWVGWLDMDDYSPLTTGLLMLRAVVGAPPDVGAFWWGTQFPASKGNTRVDHVRVYRRLDGAAKYDYEIHEQVVQSIQEQGYRHAPLPGAVTVHLNYNSTPEGQKEKLERGWPLLARATKTHPECPFAAWNMGMTLEDDGQLESAITWLDRSIALSNPRTTVLRKSYLVKARALLRLGKPIESEAAAREGLRVYPEDPELNFFLASCLVDSGRPAEAMGCLDAMKLDTSDHFGSIDIGILGPRRDFLRARAVLNLDRYGEAAGMLRPLAAQGVLEAAINRADLATAEEALGLIARLGVIDERWCAAHMRLAEARRQDPESALLAIIRAHPQEPSAHWLLAQRLVAAGRPLGAVPFLQALADLGVWEGAHNLGTIYAGHRLMRRSLKSLRRAAEIAPGNSETLSQIEAVERALAAGFDLDDEEDV